MDASQGLTWRKMASVTQAAEQLYLESHVENVKRDKPKKQN